jgi:serine/threonine protein kinase
MVVKCPKCLSDNPGTSTFCADCGTQIQSPDEIQETHTKTIETPREELTTGSTFAARYQIIEEIGKGGMGRVYKVLDKETNEKIALKLIKPEIASDKKTIERFRNELTTARKIVQKNVCRMYDLNKEKDNYYITMEYVSGGDLKRFIRRAAPLNTARTISIAKQICEGLEVAHSLGIVHRDLKPSNIMIDDNGNARIMDFGIARTVKGKGITGSGIMIGTPEYMSPEQADVKDVDQRSDIYSLGVILYEMVTGRVPFDGETPLGVAMKHKSETPKEPRELNPQIPEDLNRLILRCMEKEKEKRYQSAEELCSEMSILEKGIPKAERIIPKRKPVTSKEITVKFDSKKVLISVFILIIMAVAVYYFLFRPDRTKIDIIPGTTKQISYEPGMELDPNISPDGNMVAFSKGPLGKTHLVVRQVDGGRPIEILPDFPGNQRWPQWSPDGTLIAFQNDSINIFSLETGASDKILEAKEIHCLSWSPDGSQIAYVSGNLSFVFSQLDIPEALFPYIGNNAPCSIHIASLSSRSTVQVTSDDYLNVSPVWTPDGKHLLYISNRGGTRDIYVLPVVSSATSSGEPIRLSTGLHPHTISITKKGQKLVYSVFNYTANIWSIEIPEKGPLSISYSTAITKGNQIIEYVGVSSDGQWLAFDSNLSGNMDIYKMPAAGGEAIQLTDHPSDDFVPRWSPDGSKIAFHSFREGNRDIYLMTKDGGSIRPLTKNPSHEFSASWSPDGSKIVFFSDRTGRTELYVISKKDKGWGEPEQITFDGGNFALWSPIDDSISYLAEDRIKIISYENRKTKTIVRIQKTHDYSEPKYAIWSLDGEKIYYGALNDKGIGGIWSVPVKGGEPELKIVFDDPQISLTMNNISTDGNRFYFAPKEMESNVWIMDLISPDK